MTPSLRTQKTSDLAQTFIKSLTKKVLLASERILTLRTQPPPRCQVGNMSNHPPPLTVIFHSHPPGPMDSSFQTTSPFSQLRLALAIILMHITLSNGPRSSKIPALSISLLCHVAQSSSSSSSHHFFIPPPRRDKWERRETPLFF